MTIKMQLLRLLTAIWTLSALVDHVGAVDIADLIPLIPQCALPCILSGLTPAAISDPELTCRNVTLQASVSACIQGNCTYTEQVEVSKVNKELCKGVPIDNSRVWLQAIMMMAFFPLALLAITVRIYSRCTVSRKLGWDDWLILLSGVVLTVLLVLNLINILNNGFGRHYWNIDPVKAEDLLKTFYIAEILYLFTVSLVKASYLIFYLRIFPTRWFQIADLTVLALVIANGIGAVIAGIVQCQPISAVWNPLLKSPKCINVTALAYSQGALAVAFDIIILILPIPELLKLNMNLGKKLQVLFMFSLGSVACITSIVRLQYLVHFTRSTDSTWDNALPALWSVLEIHIAVICACLPATRQLASLWFPRFFTVNASSNYGQYSRKDPKSSTNRTQSPGPDDMIIPSRNKSPTDSSHRRFFTHIRNAEGTTFTEVWADQKGVGTTNQAHAQQYRTNSLEYPTSESSIYVLEGPRKSDEEFMVHSEARQIQSRDEESVPQIKGGHVYIEMCTTQTTSRPTGLMKPLPALRREDSLE